MRTALLITNQRPTDTGGRAEKIATRIRLFARHEWNVEIAYVPEPYIPTAPLTLGRVLERALSLDPDVVISINNPFHMHVFGYDSASSVDRIRATRRDPHGVNRPSRERCRS